MVHGFLLWIGLESFEVSDTDLATPVQLVTILGDRFDSAFE
jgi:hypothetical protein